MGRKMKNRIIKAQSVSISLPPEQISAIDLSGNRSKVIQSIIDDNMEYLGSFSIEEAEELRRIKLHEIIYQELELCIDRVIKRAVEEGLDRLSNIRTHAEDEA